MKKIIGIDINEVLRARSMQFDRFYAMEFNEEGLPPESDPYKFDLRNDYVWEDSIETESFLTDDCIEKDIRPEDYQIDEKTGVAKADAFLFKKEEKMITADEKFKRFIYEDYLFEIHGSAPLMYKGLDKHLEAFYVKYKDQFDIKIVSKENWFTIPPTLFFLSKIMSRITDYVFVESNEELIKNVDYLITTDPELLSLNQSDKYNIKLSRPYNEKSNGDIEALQLFDLIDNEDFQKLIGYKKPVIEEIIEELTNNNNKEEKNEQ